MNRLWDPSIPRSKTFRHTMTYICDNIPDAYCVELEEDLPFPTLKFGDVADSLFNVLTMLASVKVARFVRDFMRDNPPDNCGDLGLRYGRRKHLQE